MHLQVHLLMKHSKGPLNFYHYVQHTLDKEGWSLQHHLAGRSSRNADSHSNRDSFWEDLGATQQTNHSLSLIHLHSFCSSLSVRAQQKPYLLHPQIPANLMKKEDLLSIWCNISVWFSIWYKIRDGSEKVEWM